MIASLNILVLAPAAADSGTTGVRLFKQKEF